MLVNGRSNSRIESTALRSKGLATLNVNDVSLAYEFDGNAGRPVLMLPNSLGTSLELWSQQVQAFSGDFSVLRYDLRGQGESSAPAGPYSIDQMGRDAVALIDALNLDRVHFCGISMSGLIGQWLAVHAPHRLLSLILSNTAAKIGSEANWNQRIATVQKDGIEPIVSTVLNGTFTEPFHHEHPETIAKMKSILLANNPEGYAACCAAVRDADLRDVVSAAATPTLVVYGTEDRSTTSAEAGFLLDQIKGSQALELHAAHLSNIEAATAFNAGVLQFLRATAA